MNIVKSRYDRFKDCVWFPQVNDTIVLVGGCGGIGSWLSFYLARTGVTPFIYDFDTLEGHNIGGQLMKTRHVGTTKVKAMAEVIAEFTGEQKFHIMNQKITENTPTNTIVFSAFDNMEARKVSFANWRAENEGNKDSWFCDGRLGVEHWECLCIRGDDTKAMEIYEKLYLFSDDEVEDALCTMKQTSHMAGMLAGQMCGFFTNQLSNMEMKDEVTNIPFFKSYHLPTDITETKNVEDYDIS